MGIKFLIGLLNIYCVGESCVLGFGVFRYWRMICCRESVLRLSFGVVLFVMIRLIVFILIFVL